MEDYLMHHGVLGQKWGVRRFQNADGSLTAAGKQKLSKYKEKELKGLDSFYNRNIRTGFYGTKLRKQGFRSLEKERNKLSSKLESAKNKSDSDKIKKIQADLKVNTGKQKALEAMKKLETSRVKSMTYDQMKAEKAKVGKAVASNILASGIATAILMPTTGFVYIQSTDLGALKSDFRRNNFKDSKNK